eukprot:12012787-Alexandrium_andersonii.AAC.1
MAREWNEHLLEDASGLVVWQTADSSPQGAFDWMMRAGAAAKMSSVVALFDAAQRLLRPGAAVSSTEERALLAELRDCILFSPGAPCGLGSGRASAWHRMHALVHSVRLETASWESTARFL